MIVTGSFSGCSSEAGQAIQAIDGVAEAAVVGVPSERWHEWAPRSSDSIPADGGVRQTNRRT